METFDGVDVVVEDSMPLSLAARRRPILADEQHVGRFELADSRSRRDGENAAVPTSNSRKQKRTIRTWKDMVLCIQRNSRSFSLLLLFALTVSTVKNSGNAAMRDGS